MGSKKTDGTAAATIPAWAVAAIEQLAKTATVSQTTEQVLETVLRQGIKTLEKRRKETTANRVERAEALLRSMGRIA
jgi:hypothetical protein